MEFSYFESATAWATLSGLSNPIYDPITLKLATTWLSAPDPKYIGWCVCFVGQEISQTVTFPQMFIIPCDINKPAVGLRHRMISERLRETWEVIHSEATALWHLWASIVDLAATPRRIHRGQLCCQCGLVSPCCIRSMEKRMCQCLSPQLGRHLYHCLYKSQQSFQKE